MLTLSLWKYFTYTHNAPPPKHHKHINRSERYLVRDSGKPTTDKCSCYGNVSTAIMSQCSVALLLCIVYLICVGSSVTYVCVRRNYFGRILRLISR